MSCTECGRNAPVVKTDYDYNSIGLPVTLENVEVIQCAACGNDEPMLRKMPQISGLVALAVIRKPHRLTGSEVCYLRKWLGMKPAELGALLKIDTATITKWENDTVEASEQADRLVRLIAIALGNGLSAELKATVALLPKISGQVRSVKIRVNPEKLSYTYAA